MSVLVHKAVEPDNLSVKGKKRLAEMLRDGEYIVQPKLDGVYAQVVFVPEFPDAKLRVPWRWAAFSRTGEPLLSVRPEILAQFSGHDTNTRFIGELWLPETPHSNINGMARKKSVQPLELHLFDAVYPGGAPDATPYRERIAWLHAREWRRGIEVVKNIPVPNADMEYLYELAGRMKAKTSAYDGLMLKDSEGVFIPGNGKDGGAIKIKPRASGDFRVVGGTAGIGNRESGMGALIVDLGGGVTCEVGTGLNMADVHDRGVAFFKDKIVEVEYLAITKDGRLREPVFKSVRFDKDVADTLACNVPTSD